MPLAKCSDIIKLMEKYAPPELAENWDNIGLMVGEENKEINNILVSLDINDSVIDEAVKNDIDMIITHHPLIFKPIKNINSNTVIGRRIINLIKNDICVYSAHTNLDIAENGTNDTFAQILNLNNIENLCMPVIDNYGLGKIGELDNYVEFIDLIEKVKEIIKSDKIVISGNLKTKVKKVGIGTGKCSARNYIDLAVSKKCDVYITSDIGYHDAQYALEMGICLIDATHYGSEVIIVPVLCKYLNSCAEKYNYNYNCIASKTDIQTLNIV